MSDPTSAKLDEYRSLREEILQWQQKQFTAMTLTSGAIGTIIGIVAKEYVKQGWSRPGASLVFVAELLILGAAMFQRFVARQTRLIASYIREAIEPTVDGLNWERVLEARLRLHAHGAQPGEHPKGAEEATRRPGMSRWIGVYYALLLVSVLVVGFLPGIYRSPMPLVPILVLFLVAVGVLVDLIHPFGIQLVLQEEGSWNGFLSMG